MEHVSDEIEDLCSWNPGDVSTMMDWMVCALSNISRNDGDDLHALADALLGGDLGEILRFRAYERVGSIDPGDGLADLHDRLMAGYGEFVRTVEEEANRDDAVPLNEQDLGDLRHLAEHDRHAAPAA